MSGLGLAKYEALRADATRELYPDEVERIERLQAGVEARGRVGGVLLAHTEALMPSPLVQAPSNSLDAAKKAQELADNEAERRSAEAEREFQRRVS